MSNKIYGILPVVILSVGLFKGVGRSKSLFSFSKSVATQNEVNAIAKAINFDVSGGGKSPTPEEFSEYVRKNLVLKDAVHRDAATDLWGNAYVLEAQGSVLKIISPAMDKTLHTSDDIIAQANAGEY